MIDGTIDGRTALPIVGKTYLVHMVDLIWKVDGRMPDPWPEGVFRVLGGRPATERNIATVFTDHGCFGVSNPRIGWYRTFTPFRITSPGRFL